MRYNMNVFVQSARLGKKKDKGMNETRRKPDILKDIEYNYDLLKNGHDSEQCCFERFGYRPAMEFVYGVMLFRISLTNSKHKLENSAPGTTLKDIATNKDIINNISDPLGFIVCDYELDSKDRIFPKKYEDRYDYEFICKLENAFNEYIARMFSTSDEDDYLAVKPIEEIIARAIFLYGAAQLEDELQEQEYEWEEEDYALIPIDEEDNDSMRYDKEWIYEDYFQDSDIELILYSDKEVPKGVKELSGMYDYPIEKWFDKVFWNNKKSINDSI